MKPLKNRREMLCLLLALSFAVLTAFVCSSCGKENPPSPERQAVEQGLDTSRFLTAVEDEPDTVDFQCTTIHYTVANNVFNRLVETEMDEFGRAYFAPSLAKSWEVSDDGLNYTFHLRDGVSFSNGSPLTSNDVEYTFTRLLTHPDSCNQDIVEMVKGAHQLRSGEVDKLDGFKVLNDRDFTITLEQPFAAFLACLSMSGASILDEETTKAAGDRFGLDPDCTIGTGSYILKTWEPGKGMVLTANRDCWEGPPCNEGLDLRFRVEPEEVRMMFENGELDVLDLDDIGGASEYYIHGDIYQDRLHKVPRIAITYIALNESVAPLDDARVRKALQLALDRTTLLYAIHDGFGSVENGIYPYGLKGHNPNLPEIPFSSAEAKKLLEEAGYPDGFDLTVAVNASTTQREMTLVELVVDMWKAIGVRASAKVMQEDEFMRLRKSGGLACYSAMWTADYDDPDNFANTFFGGRENTTFRSICYQRDDIMDRVHQARTITDDDERIKEYQDLERIIVQEDAAWIPLYSRLHLYVVSERVEGFQYLWNGSVKSKYNKFTLRETG